MAAAFAGAAPRLPRRRPRSRNHLHCTSALSLPVSRRHALHTLAAFGAHLLVAPAREALASDSSGAKESTIFQVRSAAESDVTLWPVSADAAFADLAGADLTLLGVNHGSQSDHALAARILSAVSERTPTALGVEAVERRFQGALDRYSEGTLSEEGLLDATQWEARWGWPFEAALPVLRAARRSALSARALGADAEAVARVRAPGGLANLTGAELREAIGDPDGFAALSAEPGFREYVRECITPSYAAHARMGLLSPQADFVKFYSARVLTDESIAGACAGFVRAHPGTRLVAVLGKEHVKFGYGVGKRVQRLLGKGACVRSVVLNPVPIDAYDARYNSLKLEMGTGKQPSGVLIADYLWFSSADRKTKKARQGTWKLPPVEQLVLPENVVNAR